MADLSRSISPSGSRGVILKPEPSARIRPGMGFTAHLPEPDCPHPVVSMCSGELAGLERFWETVTSPAVAAYEVRITSAFIAAIVRHLWPARGLVLVRYRFPGRQLIDGLVDLPFAAAYGVAGITLTASAITGGVVRIWKPLGIKSAYSAPVIVIALTSSAAVRRRRCTDHPDLDQEAERPPSAPPLVRPAGRPRPGHFPALLAGDTHGIARGVRLVLGE